MTFVRNVTGVNNVCERAAALAARGKLLFGKTARNGIMLAAADFVICLYNPKSKKRVNQLHSAVNIILNHKDSITPCGYAKNIGRRGETAFICTLGNLASADIDMLTTVIIGNNETKVINGRLITARFAWNIWTTSLKAVNVINMEFFMKVYIIGAGPGDEQYLTDYARDLILNAGMVVATQRLVEQFWHLNPNTACESVDKLADTVAGMRNEQTNVCVLVSGDAGFYSVSKTLCATFREAGIDFECVNGISCLQYFASALGVTYEDSINVSVHGRENSVVPYVCYNPKVFVLTGGSCKAHDVIAGLNEAGLGHVKVSLGENLGAEDEAIVVNTAQNMSALKFGDLTIMLIQNEAYAKYWEIIDDNEFVRGQAPMTRQAVRRLSLAKLNIKPDDVVADIGAGTGSVSVEAARLAHCGVVLAIEKNADALSLIRQNIKKFGAYNVAAKEATAPDGLDVLPVIDKAFIGGSGGKLNQIVEALLTNNPRVRIVINAIALETLAIALETLQAHNLKPEVMSVNVALAEKTGPYNLMKAQNPVYIISGGGSGE